MLISGGTDEIKPGQVRASGNSPDVHLLFPLWGCVVGPHSPWLFSSSPTSSGCCIEYSSSFFRRHYYVVFVTIFPNYVRTYHCAVTPIHSACEPAQKPCSLGSVIRPIWYMILSIVREACPSARNSKYSCLSYFNVNQQKHTIVLYLKQKKSPTPTCFGPYWPIIREYN